MSYKNFPHTNTHNIHIYKRGNRKKSIIEFNIRIVNGFYSHKFVAAKKESNAKILKHLLLLLLSIFFGLKLLYTEKKHF